MKQESRIYNVKVKVNVLDKGNLIEKRILE